jgi:hypothetical protein
MLVYCLLFTVYCLLFSVFCFLVTVYCLLSRGGRSAYEFRYALFRYVAKQGKWEAPAIYWRFQTVS